MNAKTRIAMLALAAMLFGSNALADQRYSKYAHHHRVQYDYAQVISAEPIVNYVTVSAPVRECWEEMEYYSVDRNANRRGGSTLVGAIIGGVVGHQFGSGSGNDAATVAGTLVGAAIGNDAAKRRYPRSDLEYSRPGERCTTTMRQREEERIDGLRLLQYYQKHRLQADAGKACRCTAISLFG